MISLYESILSSTGSGKERIAEAIKKWFFSCSSFKWILLDFIIEDDVKIEPYKGMWKINIDTNIDKNYFTFDRADSNGTGKLPYKIYGIYIKGKPINIGYNNLDFDNPDDFVQEVDENITFRGCKIKKLDRLPKNCKEINLNYAHMIGGGHSSSVDEISKINVDYFVTSEASSKMGLRCRLDRINGITVKHRFEICDSMLGYFSLEKGNRIFTQDVSDLLDEFFKNNNVDPEKCMFNSNDGKIGEIIFDKKINRWRFKPYFKK